MSQLDWMAVFFSADNSVAVLNKHQAHNGALEIKGSQEVRVRYDPTWYMGDIISEGN